MTLLAQHYDISYAICGQISEKNWQKLAKNGHFTKENGQKVKNGLGDQKKNPTDDAQQPLGVTFWHRRQGLWVGFLGRIVVDAGMCGFVLVRHWTD